MERIDVKECHMYLLQIAKVFHEVCERNQIPYYMIGGTMLGAIRHHGFIPWDDDMDFGVPRKYYRALIEILDKELPSSYKIHSIYHSDCYSNGFFKIEDSRTLIKEVGEVNMSIGVNIDIFPLDKTNSKKGFFSKNYWISELAKLETYCFSNLEGLGLFRIIVNKVLSSMMYFVSNKTIFNFINRHLLLINGDYIVNHYGAYALNEIVRKDIIGTPVLYKFEDTEFYGVEKYDEYLRHFYGDYMQMPRGKANHFHIEKLFVTSE